MKMRKKIKNDSERRLGVLVSMSSMPGEFGIGDFGRESRCLLDRLSECGIRTLSLLPTNSTGFGNSPYQSPSAFAGNINYISPQSLFEDGLLRREDLEKVRCSRRDMVDYGQIFDTREPMLKKAYGAFVKGGGLQNEEYRKFCRISGGWLDDFAAYMAIKGTMNYRSWNQWPPELAGRKEPAYSCWLEEHREELEFWKFTQFIFFRQWGQWKEYANERGIEIIGDMPFYVAADSADVWSRPELFAVNPESGRIELWAGVPADDFSGSDRNWGNPVYNWNNHRKDDYAWFRKRIRMCGAMYDALRIDHVIAMMRYFGIKDGENKGKWYDGPETADNGFSRAICEEAEKSGLSIIAEDLGRVPDGLRERMEESGWPGMRILQFAFVGKYGAKSNHLPFCHQKEMVVYTGTHDNATLKEFLSQKTDKELEYMKWWTGKNTKEELQWALIEECCKSPANLAIIPIQDLLELGEEARMVYSDDYDRSWKWRLSGIEQLHEDVCRRIKKTAVLTGRCGVENDADFFQYLEW